MARRCSREQDVQKTRDRPFSTAVVQVSGSSAPGTVVPQKSQVWRAGSAIPAAYARDGAVQGRIRKGAGPRQRIAARARQWLLWLLSGAS